MNEIEYSVYGIIEPGANKIVYIDIYRFNKGNENFPNKEIYIDYSIKEMCKNKNQYARDLINMRKVNKEDGIHIINFDYCDNKEDAEYIKKEMLLQFKPRYNIK